MNGNIACLGHYEVDYEERFYLAVDTVTTAEYFVCLLYLVKNIINMTGNFRIM